MDLLLKNETKEAVIMANKNLTYVNEADLFQTEPYIGLDEGDCFRKAYCEGWRYDIIKGQFYK